MHRKSQKNTKAEKKSRKEREKRLAAAVGEEVKKGGTRKEGERGQGGGECRKH